MLSSVASHRALRTVEDACLKCSYTWRNSSSPMVASMTNGGSRVSWSDFPNNSWNTVLAQISQSSRFEWGYFWTMSQRWMVWKVRLLPSNLVKLWTLHKIHRKQPTTEHHIASLECIDIRDNKMMNKVIHPFNRSPLAPGHSKEDSGHHDKSPTQTPLTNGASHDPQPINHSAPNADMATESSSSSSTRRILKPCASDSQSKDHFPFPPRLWRRPTPPPPPTPSRDGLWQSRKILPKSDLTPLHRSALPINPAAPNRVSLASSYTGTAS